VRRIHAAVLIALAALAIVAYAPVLSQPLIENDYPNLEISRVYGPVSAWPELMADPVHQYRATYVVLTHWVDSLTSEPAAFYAVSIFLHVLCVWLVYALGSWRVIGWRVAVIAAAFFAVHEGHQEAVMWLSAASELLQFLFGLGALLCWIRFLNRGGGRAWYAGALACFLLALLSKETAAIWAVLLLAPIWISGRWRALVEWLPFALMSLWQTGLLWASRGLLHNLSDGTYSIWAPFYATLPVSYGRLLWFWGLAALAALGILRARQHRQLVLIAAVWMAIALAPYSFLLSTPRLPSRCTYLASLGLAWLVAAGFWALHSRLYLHRQLVAGGLMAVLVGVNVGYLWSKKRQQYLERAAPTEALLALARRVNGPIYMNCGTNAARRYVFDAAVRLRTRSTVVWDARPAPGAATFCWKGK
jgi:hypothetical protein